MQCGSKRFGSVSVSNATAHELRLEFSLSPGDGCGTRWDLAAVIPPRSAKGALPHECLFLPVDARVRLTRPCEGSAVVVSESLVGQCCALEVD